MTSSFRIRRALATRLLLAGTLPMARPALAQSATYPNRPVRLVVPYPPGGGTDITARAIAARLSDSLGQPVTIENKPGATGMIGAATVARSTPDGYTVLFGAASEMAINVSLYRKMNYDPRTDLEPVSLVATFALVLLVPGDSTDTLESILETARRRPRSVTYGSIGAGSPQHLAGEYLASQSKTLLVHVPYKGSGPLVQDAVAGHLALAISSVPPAVPLIRAGRLRALAVTSANRVASLPDVPTVAELGFAGFEFNTWVGAAVPTGTPRAVIDRLNEALTASLGVREVQSTLREQGAQPVGSSPRQLREFIRQEIGRSDRIVAQAGIQLD